MSAATTWLIALAAATGASSESVDEIGCGAVIEDARGVVQTVKDASLKVLDQTTANATFSYTGHANTRAIICGRTDIVPAVNDFKVTAAGFPLDIVHASEAEGRVGALEMSGGQFRFRMLKGKLTEDEAQRVLLRLNEFQTAVRAPE